MKGLLERCMIVEVNTVPNKEGKIYPKLCVVEVGQQYPKLIGLRLDVDPGSLNSLVGTVVDIAVNLQEYTGKTGPYSVYTYLGVQRQRAA